MPSDTLPLEQRCEQGLVRAIGREVLKQFPDVEYAFSYGSMVRKQGVEMTNADVQSSLKKIEWNKWYSQDMMDFVLVVANTTQWHGANVNQYGNIDHYSYLGKKESFRRRMVRKGASVMYMPYIRVEIKDPMLLAAGCPPFITIKYGVVSMDAFMNDLMNWDNLYLAGRMHKPVVVLQSNPQVTLASNLNQHHAVKYTLLQLPAVFTEYDFLKTLIGISYKGDVRAEDPNKIEKILNGSLVFFRDLYGGILPLYTSHVQYQEDGGIPVFPDTPTMSMGTLDTLNDVYTQIQTVDSTKLFFQQPTHAKHRGWLLHELPAKFIESVMTPTKDKFNYVEYNQEEFNFIGGVIKSYIHETSPFGEFQGTQIQDLVTKQLPNVVANTKHIGLGTNTTTEILKNVIPGSKLDFPTLSDSQPVKPVVATIEATPKATKGMSKKKKASFLHKEVQSQIASQSNTSTSHDHNTSNTEEPRKTLYSTDFKNVEAPNSTLQRQDHLYTTVLSDIVRIDETRVLSSNPHIEASAPNTVNSVLLPVANMLPLKSCIDDRTTLKLETYNPHSDVNGVRMFEYPIHTPFTPITDATAAANSISTIDEDTPVVVTKLELDDAKTVEYWQFLKLARANIEQVGEIVKFSTPTTTVVNITKWNEIESSLQNKPTDIIEYPEHTDQPLSWLQSLETKIRTNQPDKQPLLQFKKEARIHEFASKRFPPPPEVATTVFTAIYATDARDNQGCLIRTYSVENKNDQLSKNQIQFQDSKNMQTRMQRLSTEKSVKVFQNQMHPLVEKHVPPQYDILHSQGIPLHKTVHIDRFVLEKDPWCLDRANLQILDPRQITNHMVQTLIASYIPTGVIELRKPSEKQRWRVGAQLTKEQIENITRKVLQSSTESSTTNSLSKSQEAALESPFYNVQPALSDPRLAPGGVARFDNGIRWLQIMLSVKFPLFGYSLTNQNKFVNLWKQAQKGNSGQSQAAITQLQMGNITKYFDQLNNMSEWAKFPEAQPEMYNATVTNLHRQVQARIKFSSIRQATYGFFSAGVVKSTRYALRKIMKALKM